MKLLVVKWDNRVGSVDEASRFHFHMVFHLVQLGGLSIVSDRLLLMHRYSEHSTVVVQICRAQHDLMLVDGELLNSVANVRNGC